MEEYSRSDFIEENSMEDWYIDLEKVKNYLWKWIIQPYISSSSLWMSQSAQKFLSEISTQEVLKLSSLIEYILENKIKNKSLNTWWLRKNSDKFPNREQSILIDRLRQGIRPQMPKDVPLIYDCVKSCIPHDNFKIKCWSNDALVSEIMNNLVLALDLQRSIHNLRKIKYTSKDIQIDLNKYSCTDDYDILKEIVYLSSWLSSKKEFISTIEILIKSSEDVDKANIDEILYWKEDFSYLN